MIRTLVLDLYFVVLLIYNGVLKISGTKSCPKTDLHVTNMCSPDNFFSNFIYLDVHNASLYYLQSCICTLHVRFPGTLYFKTLQTPPPDCGSVMHVTSSDGNQVHVFHCGGNTSFPVKTNDMINISIHNLGELSYDTSYCYVISLASDSGVGTNAFQITCPDLERLTTTTTTSTVTSSTPATSPKPTSTAKVTASLTSTRPSNIAPTTESESTSAVLEVKESVVRQDVPLEVIITVAILVPVASIGIVLVSIYLWRRKILQRLLRNLKKDHRFREEAVIDVGDGLKENVSNHSNEDLSKEDKAKISVVNVRIANTTPKAPRVVTLRKSHSNKNIIVLSSEKSSRKANGSDEADDVALDERRNRLHWKRSETDSGYFTEIHLGSGSKTIITVENLPKLHNEEQIKYDDIQTEL